MKGSVEVKSLVSSLWGLQVVMGWCWKLVLHDNASVHSSTVSHLWWTFPSTSLKFPQELQQIHCSLDGVGCWWCSELDRTQGTAGIPWKCIMVHCGFSAQMVIQILWKPSQAPLSMHVWNCLEVSWRWWICWSSHQSRCSQSCSNKTDLFPGCGTGVVELRWHFQLAWLLWSLIGRFHIFPQLRRCCHLFQAKTRTPWLSTYIFHSFVSFVYLLQGFPSQSGRYENSETLGCNSVFDGQVFPIVPIDMELLWKLPSLNRPSIQNVMHQQLEFRILPCFLMDLVQIVGTVGNVCCYLVDCNYGQLNSIFHR